MEVIKNGLYFRALQEEAEKELDDAQIKGDDVGKYLAWNKVSALADTAAVAFNHAIALAQDYYHLKPESSHGALAKPRDPNGLWLSGKTAYWNPRFLGREEKYFMVGGQDNKDHYLGEKFNLKEQLGATFPDGQAFIFPRIFELVEKAGNPGPLAFAIHHEGRHFRDLLKQALDTQATYEVDAYEESLKMADIFELDKDFQEEFIRSNLKWYRFVAAGGGPRNFLYPSPDKEARNKAEYERLAKEQTDLEQEYASLKVRVEAWRREQQERERRETEGNQSQERRQAEIDRFARWAKWFGFKTIYSREGLIWGFEHEKKSGYFSFTNFVTTDEGLAVLFMAFACVHHGLRVDAKNEQAFLTIARFMNRHWSDADFRDRTKMKVIGFGLSDCIKEMRDTLRVPFGLDEIEGLMNGYWRRWEKEHAGYRDWKAPETCLHADGCAETPRQAPASDTPASPQPQRRWYPIGPRFGPGSAN